MFSYCWGRCYSSPQAIQGFFKIQNPQNQEPERKSRVRGPWDMRFHEMNRQLASRDIMQTKGGLLTKMRVMDSKPMHFVKQDTHGHFSSGTNPHLGIGCRKDIRHYMQEFWECLTSWTRSITIVCLIIFICQQNLQKHHLHMTERFRSLDHQEEWKGATKVCHSRGKEEPIGDICSLWNSQGRCVGWRQRSA